MSERRPTGWDSMSMFDELVEHAVDDDYQAVADARGGDGGGSSRRTAASAVSVVAIVAVFAALIAVSAVQTRNDRPRAQGEREQLIAEIEQQRGFLADKRDRGAILQAQVATLVAAAPDDSGSARVGGLRRATGKVAASGPGIEVIADNADDALDEPRGRVTDRDLQILVNGLWLAGADAVSVNDNRLTTLSSIRTAGEAITVNYRSLTPPYKIDALGDTRTLESRFLDTPSGQAWSTLQKNYGLRFETRSVSELELPAAPPRRLQVRHAVRLGADS